MSNSNDSTHPSKELKFYFDPETGACYRSLEFLGLPHYRVGDDGSVWTRRVRTSPTKIGPWKIMYPSCHRGYKRALIGNRQLIPVHHLVLLAFIGPRPEGMLCRHYPDRNPSNNRVENLKWGTAKENQADRILHDTHHRGERQGLAVLTAGNVLEIRRRYHEFLKTGRRRGIVQRLADEFKVTNSTVQHVVKGRSWKHLPTGDTDDDCGLS